jgi:hypothetical protein
MLRRKSAWADALRAYAVTIDGNRVGRIRDGEEQAFEVAPGRHVVRVGIDWARSEPVEADVVADRAVSLSCGPRSRMLWLWWFTFGCRRYPRLVRD